MPTNNIKDSPRSRSSGAAGVQRSTLAPEKSASFHGRLPTSEHRTLRRPKTQPDLLADSGRRRTPAPGKETPEIPWATSAASSGGAPAAPQIRVPSKVLVNVTVQRSLGAVHVVASTDWTVGQLVAAVLQQYVKEGRRPPLPSSDDPSAFALHYSQFSLDCLEAKERLIGLGSRNFFMCPKPAAAAAASSASGSPAREKTCSKEAAASEMKASSKGGGSGSGITSLPWLRFMDFLL